MVAVCNPAKWTMHGCCTSTRMSDLSVWNTVVRTVYTTAMWTMHGCCTSTRMSNLSVWNTVVGTVYITAMWTMCERCTSTRMSNLSVWNTVVGTVYITAMWTMRECCTGSSMSNKCISSAACMFIFAEWIVSNLQKQQYRLLSGPNVNLMQGHRSNTVYTEVIWHRQCWDVAKVLLQV